MSKKKKRVFIEGTVEVPAGPGAEDRTVGEIAADLGLEDEPKESKADFDFEREVAAEVKAIEQSSRPGFTPPFDMADYLRHKLISEIDTNILTKDFQRFPRPAPIWVLCPDQKFSFDYRGPDRDYRYEISLGTDDERQLRVLVDQVLSSANSPFIFGGLRIYLHAAQGHRKAPEHLTSGQVSLKVELIFRASAP